MQKIVLIALLFACAYSATNISAGTATGFSVTMGVAHRCHVSCATCSGGLVNDCLTCHDTTITLTAGVCACTGTDYLSGDATPKVMCVAAGTAAPAQALCTGNAGFFFNTDKCEQCPVDLKTCGPTTGTDALTCWAGVTKTGALCTYAATTSYVSGDDTAYDNSAATPSVLNGYYYEATGFIQKPCNKGCLTCDLGTAAVLCSTCATGFTLVGTTNLACECSSTGFFMTAATTAALDLCTACQTGCTTCSSATVCTVCDSSNELGSTTDSSSTCQALATTDATTTDTSATSTTDGESSMTATTDASTTNGVLITAASVLLAVILA